MHFLEKHGRNHRDIKLIATETRGDYLVLDVEIKLSCNKNYFLAIR